MHAHQIPGVEVGVMQDGQITVDQGYGLADVESGAPVTPQTRFEIGSVTKQFTAAAILQLKERGKLRLSDPLSEYVPEYAAGKDVTIEQLLWQVSGIPDYLNDVASTANIAGTTPGGLNAALGQIKGMPLFFAPGAQWRYSNTNYLLLSTIVERVSHKPFEQYIRENIFSPAGMTLSAFAADEPSLQNMATGYTTDAKGNLVKAPRILEGWSEGAGAIVSTVRDLTLWDRAFFGGKIVDPADVALATNPHVLPDGHSTHYGFGWVVDTYDGEAQIWHNGGTLGFGAANEYYPQLHEAIVVLVNNVNAAPTLVSSGVFDAVNPSIAVGLAKPAAGEDPRITQLAREWVHDAQTGQIDRSQLDAAMSKAMTPAVIARAQAQLEQLGEPSLFVYKGKQTVGSVTVYRYRVTFKAATAMVLLGLDPDGKIAEMLFRPG